LLHAVDGYPSLL